MLRGLAARAGQFGAVPGCPPASPTAWHGTLFGPHCGACPRLRSLAAAPRPRAGLSRADPDSPSKFAEALLGREFNSKSLQQFLQHGGEVLRFWMQGLSAEGVRCAGGRAGGRVMLLTCERCSRPGVLATHMAALPGPLAYPSSFTHPRRRSYKLHYFVADSTVRGRAAAAAVARLPGAGCRHLRPCAAPRRAPLPTGCPPPPPHPTPLPGGDHGGGRPRGWQLALPHLPQARCARGGGLGPGAAGGQACCASHARHPSGAALATRGGRDASACWPPPAPAAGPLPRAVKSAPLPGQARLGPEDVYAPADLRVGASLTILGRPFLIYAADAATRAWYTVRAGGGGAGGG